MLLSRLQEPHRRHLRCAASATTSTTSWSPTAARLPAAARGGTAEEELIVAEPAGGSDELALSLYLDPALLARLARADPLGRLHAGNVADYWTALEGVSHFLYLAWNAGHDKPVSLLELEMQAEVDKYVASYWLLRQPVPGRFPAELRRLLFARTRVDPRAGARAPAFTARPVVMPSASAGLGARCRGSHAGRLTEPGAGGTAALLPPDAHAQARATSRRSARQGAACAPCGSGARFAAAAVALALLELAHQLDPLRQLAQIGARGVAGGGAALSRWALGRAYGSKVSSGLQAQVRARRKPRARAACGQPARRASSPRHCRVHRARPCRCGGAPPPASRRSAARVFLY